MGIDRRSAVKLLAAPALLGGIAALSSPARAESYPAKPVRIIVPFPAGGPFDGIPRLVAQWISAQQGWSVVIDNRTGASGIIGVMAAKQAAPDGYTLVVATTSTHGSMPALKRSLGYDAVRDFAPIVLLADAALVLLVRAELPVHRVADLITLLRETPGRLNYSTGGYGSPHHLATMTLFQRTGLPQNAAVHVPFAGLAPALTALLAGNVEFMIASTGTSAQHIASGKLRPLATTGRQRSSRLPEVPTMAELGYADFEVVPWCGLSAPAGTAEDMIGRWNELANTALRDAKLREQIAAFDYDIRGGTAQEFAEFTARDIGRYKKLAEAMGWPRIEPLMPEPTTLRCMAAGAAALGIVLATPPVRAQDSAPPSWMIPDIAAAARAEGALTIYSSMNEQEGLPLWKMFEDASGVKVSYVRTSDSIILSRIAIEHRARQRSWDIAVTTTVNRLPNDALAQFDPPQAQGLIPEARDPNRRWYGVYANYNTPAYNTDLVKASDLPKSYEEFLTHKEWAGKIALDDTDDEWLSAIIRHYGEDRGKKLLRDMVSVLKPVMVDGHLALARSVGAGEYWLALNNYASLTVNVRLAGAPTDFWPLDPVALFFGSVGVSAQAPHPKAAQLAANFILSREAEQFLTRRGRMPTRTDVPVNPPEVADMLKGKKIIATIFGGDEQKKWQGLFKDIFKAR